MGVDEWTVVVGGTGDTEKRVQHLDEAVQCFYKHFYTKLYKYCAVRY